MPIPAGDLHHRVQMERRVEGQDSYGQEIEGWAPLGITRAIFMPGTGQERREAAQERASISAVFRMRRFPVTAGLKAADRLRFNPFGPLDESAPAWDIISVVPFERGGVDVTAVRAD